MAWLERWVEVGMPLDFFDHYGSAVGEDFGDSADDFVGVVADGDDGVCA